MVLSKGREMNRSKINTVNASKSKQNNQRLDINRDDIHIWR